MTNRIPKIINLESLIPSWSHEYKFDLICAIEKSPKKPLNIRFQVTVSVFAFSCRVCPHKSRKFSEPDLIFTINELGKPPHAEFPENCVRRKFIPQRINNEPVLGVDRLNVLPEKNIIGTNQQLRSKLSYGIIDNFISWWNAITNIIDQCITNYNISVLYE